MDTRENALPGRKNVHRGKVSRRKAGNHVAPHIRTGEGRTGGRGWEKKAVTPQEEESKNREVTSIPCKGDRTNSPRRVERGISLKRR